MTKINSLSVLGRYLGQICFRNMNVFYKLQDTTSVGFVADGNAPLTSSTMVLPGFSNFWIIGQPSLR